MRHAAAKYVTDHAMLDSPVGRLLIGGDGAEVLLIGFPSGSRAVAAEPDWRRDDALYPEARGQILEYLAGTRTGFDFPMRLVGTAFQTSLWRALLDIPFGSTTTYTDLAHRIGRPKAIRAVGAANGANPLPIVVPCHRVLGRDGSLTGFGGGLDLKRRLLELERTRTP